MRVLVAAEMSRNPLDRGLKQVAEGLIWNRVFCAAEGDVQVKALLALIPHSDEI